MGRSAILPLYDDPRRNPAVYFQTYSPASPPIPIRRLQTAPLWTFSIAKAIRCYRMAGLEAPAKLLERRLLSPLAL